MSGTFNGVPLRQITSINTTHPDKGITHDTFRVLDREPKLEQALQLGAAALLILSNREIEGRIVGYSADIQAGYEITIESKA